MATVRVSVLAGSLLAAVLASDGRTAESPTLAPALAAVAPFPAELGLPLQRYFSAEDYDGYTSVTAVAHTAEGFTLFGTYHAAVLYDGVTHEKIPFPGTYVTALCRADDGTMWAAGDNEIGVIAADATDGALRYTSHTHRLPEAARAFGRMRALVAGRAGLFAATSSGVLHFSTERIAVLPVSPESQLQLFAVGGRVFLLDSRRGLLVFEGADFRPVETGRSLLGRRIQLVEHTAAHAHCAIEGEGLFRLEFATGRLEKLATPLDALLAEPLGRGLRLLDGRVAFIRGPNRGLLLADPDLQGAQILDAKTGLANTTIVAAARDADHGLWLGTANGLVRLDLAPGLTVFDERNAFPIGSASSLVRSDGVLYAATTQGLMRLEPGRPATGTPARFVPDPRVPETCDNLRATPNGLLFSTLQAVELLTASGRRRLFAPPARIAMIKANRRVPGLYFIATHDGGFHVLRLPEGTTRRVLTLPPAVILWNGADESDRVSWFGSAASGFWRITATDREWSQATAESFPLGRGGLPDGKSWSGAFPLFDELHFLTGSGLYRWDSATNSFPFDHRFQIEGVDPLRFMPVVADSAGRAWTSPWRGTVACAKPLGYFQATGSGSFSWRDAPARWQAGVGRFGASLIVAEKESDRSHLWTKSPTTIARLELDTLAANQAGRTWRPSLRRFTTGERSWPIAGSEMLRLPFSNLPITLRYAAPRYQPGPPLRYQTRLLGFRDEWSAPAASHETVFTNLTGGPFEFEVRAIDADGFTSETARFAFAVALPWHRTPGAIAGGIGALVAAVFGFVRWRLRHAERERLRLEQLVARRTEELRHAKDAADAANRAKSTFLANMSHELRTPLNGVIGYAQVLMKDRELTPRNRERVQVVQTSGEHLLRMINEVLDFSKIEAGRMELFPAPFHLPQLLRNIAAALGPRFEQKGLAFLFEPSPTLPDLVVGDAGKLRQILDNLLGNALKFTARGHVRLTVAPADPASETVRIQIADTGVGIGPADLARLFQPFQQAVDGRPPEPGTGLGLAIARRLVELMGGELTVESEPGRGSVFSFSVRLPILAASAAADRRPAAAVTGYRGPRRRILIVDDVATNRAVLRELLAPLGFDLHETATGARALDAVPTFAPDVVLLDLRMPGIDGFEFARRIRTLPGGAAPKLLAMSASVLAFSRDDAFAAGCDDFLPKPFREDDLLGKLALALRLEWIRAANDDSAPSASDPSPRTSPTSPAAAPGDLAALAALLACARRGEIRAIRERLAALRAAGAAPSPLLDELDTLARDYRMEQLGETLARHLRIHA